MIPSLILAASLPLVGGDVAVPLLKDSKNQPALAVLVGKTLYFTEAVALNEPGGACRARDLYRVGLDPREGRQEERIAAFPCVTEVRAFGDAAYVVYRAEGDSERRVARFDGDKADDAFPERVEKAKARVAWKRVTAGLPRRPIATLVGLAPGARALWAVFHTGGDKPGLVAEPVAHTGSAAPEPLALPAERNAPEEVAVTGDGQWLALRAGTAGSEIVRFDRDAAKAVVLKGQRPLSKDWQEVAEDKYFARAPRFLAGGDREAFVADRTDQIFTEVSAIAAFGPANKRFRRLSRVPSEDVGGLQSMHGGLLVSKPLAGQVVWYGPRLGAPAAFAPLAPTAPASDSKRQRSGGKP